jgi:hypothetical protein
MSTFKDILYKKEDNETWTEWSKRVPDNDEDKLDYIEETIYVKIYDHDKEKAGYITDILRCMGVEGLIPLLESEELLDAKIEEAYKTINTFEENMYNEKEYEEEEILYPVKTITVAEMIAALSVLPHDTKLVMTESGFYSNSEFAEVMLPKIYTVQNDRCLTELPTGTQVYCIGHSHQSY